MDHVKKADVKRVPTMGQLMLCKMLLWMALSMQPQIQLVMELQISRLRVIRMSGAWHCGDKTQ
jgi:hypothetical protein